MATCACEQCGRSFITRRRRKFCTHDCSAKYRSQTRTCELRCAGCGTSFLRRASCVGEVNYCSLACSSASRIVTYTCERCNKEFRPTKRGTQKFCSRSCRADAMKGDPAVVENMAKARSAAAEKRESQKAEREAALPHGTFTRYVKRRCRCEICVVFYREYAAQYRKTKPPLTAEQQANATARSLVWSRTKYEESLPNASRRGYVWTGPELELLAREDLSSRDLAAMLGRTTYAVQFQRQKLRREEPRSVALAGVK